MEPEAKRPKGDPGSAVALSARGLRWLLARDAHAGLTVAICLALVAALGLADYVSGSELGLALFYLLPVLACASLAGATAGMVVAAAATCAWFWADVAARHDPRLWLSVWNASSRFVIFAVAVNLTARLRAGREHLKALNQELGVLLDGERGLARTDALTALANSRAFLETLGVEIARSKRNGQALCIAYLDLDDFKPVNDRSGHAAGDEVLKQVGTVLRQATRAGDVPARLAGDEFAVLLAGVTPESAEQIAQRIIEGVRAIEVDGASAGIGASVGVVYFTVPPADAAAALRVADAAMYQAKSLGKGRAILDYVAVADEALPSERSDAEQRRTSRT